MATGLGWDIGIYLFGTSIGYARKHYVIAFHMWTFMTLMYELKMWSSTINEILTSYTLAYLRRFAQGFKPLRLLKMWNWRML